MENAHSFYIFFLLMDTVPLVWTWLILHGSSGDTFGSSLPLCEAWFSMRTRSLILESKYFSFEFSLMFGWSILFYSVLFCSFLFFSILFYSIVLCCIVLYCAVLCCNHSFQSTWEEKECSIFLLKATSSPHE